MADSILKFQTRGQVAVARVTIPQIVHPAELEMLGRELHEFLDTGQAGALVLDLSALEYLTSAALGALLNIHVHLKARGKGFAIVAASEMVVETLRHTRLQEVLPVLPDVDSAVDAVSGA